MPDLLAALAESIAAVQRQREIDKRPCPTCGGDPLRPDFREPGPPCHAPWPAVEVGREVSP